MYLLRTSLSTFLTLPCVPAIRAQTPPQSTFFSTAAEEAYSTYQIPGSGDLWPTCWADDDNVYTASGDGTAFYGGNATHALAVSRLAGMPPNLVGTSLARNVGTPLTVSVNSRDNSTVTVFAGGTGQNTALWMRVDDVSLR